MQTHTTRIIINIKQSTDEMKITIFFSFIPNGIHYVCGLYIVCDICMETIFWFGNNLYDYFQFSNYGTPWSYTAQW